MLWTKQRVRARLRELGWPGHRSTLDQDIRAFQAGWRLGPPLAVDGKVGPKTRYALTRSLQAHQRGEPDLSAHFRWSEFACRCGGTLPGCRAILVLRPLLDGLEKYRKAVGGPVDIVSGYRCPERNRRVGGASQSQHVLGAAADVEYALTDKRVTSLGVFSGIGRSKRTRKVRHVDVRHLSGSNVTGGQPHRPTVWDY